MITPVYAHSDRKVGSVPHSSLPAAGLRSFYVRYFFVGMSALTLIVAVTGFFPSVRDIATGEYKPHWFAHVHGAIMTSWLLLFLTQAILAAKGQLRFHRRLGVSGVVHGVMVWLSMGVAIFSFNFAVNYPVGDFSYDILLLGLIGMGQFGFLFVRGILARKTDPAAHKRLLLLPTVLVLQAAIDRMHWLPGLYATAYTRFFYEDALLIPLFIYDAVTLGRIHRSTWQGTAVILVGQVLFSMFFHSLAWHRFWFDFFGSLR